MKIGDLEVTNYTIDILYMSEPEEMEKNNILRILRDKLGYGGAWKFKDALWDLVFPFIPPLIIIFILVYLLKHIRIIWIQ